MTTMRDLARRIGVSVSTVSRALSGHPYVDEDLRQRVRDLADELGYRPNPLARGLRSNRTSTIGLIVPDVFNPSYFGLAAVLQSRLRELGYGLVLAVNNNDRETDRQCLTHLQEQQVDGICYVPASTAPPVTLIDRSSGVPVIELFRRTASSPYDGIVHDEDVGAAAIMEHLLALGHQQIGMIAGPRGYSTTRRRVTGALRAIQTANHDPEMLRVVHHEYSPAGGQRGFRELVDGGSPPTAIIAASPQFVLGSLIASRQLGVAVPDYVSLAGMGDPEWYQVAAAPVTTYASPIRELGLLAVQLLVARMEQRDPYEKPTQVVVSGTLVERQSTCPPRRATRHAGKKKSAANPPSTARRTR